VACVSMLASVLLLALPISVIGEAVQVDPITATMKAPGTKRSKLKYDELLSSFAFNFNLGRYTSARSSRSSGWSTRTRSRAANPRSAWRPSSW